MRTHVHLEVHLRGKRLAAGAALEALSESFVHLSGVVPKVALVDERLAAVFTRERLIGRVQFFHVRPKEGVGRKRLAAQVTHKRLHERMTLQVQQQALAKPETLSAVGAGVRFFSGVTVHVSVERVSRPEETRTETALEGSCVVPAGGQVRVQLRRLCKLGAALVAGQPDAGSGGTRHVAVLQVMEESVRLSAPVAREPLGAVVQLEVPVPQTKLLEPFLTPMAIEAVLHRVDITQVFLQVHRRLEHLFAFWAPELLPENRKRLARMSLKQFKTAEFCPALFAEEVVPNQRMNLQVIVQIFPTAETLTANCTLELGTLACRSDSFSFEVSTESRVQFHVPIINGFRIHDFVTDETTERTVENTV